MTAITETQAEINVDSDALRVALAALKPWCGMTRGTVNHVDLRSEDGHVLLTAQSPSPYRPLHFNRDYGQRSQRHLQPSANLAHRAVGGHISTHANQRRENPMTFYRPSPMSDAEFRAQAKRADTVAVPLETVRRVVDELASEAFHDYRTKRAAGTLRANDAAHPFFHVMTLHNAMTGNLVTPEEKLGELVPTDGVVDLREVSA